MIATASPSRRLLGVLVVVTALAVAAVACSNGEPDRLAGIAVSEEIEELALGAVVLEGEVELARLEAARARADADALTAVAARERSEVAVAAEALEEARERGEPEDVIDELVEGLVQAEVEAAAAEEAAEEAERAAQEAEDEAERLEDELAETNETIDDLVDHQDEGGEEDEGGDEDEDEDDGCGSSTTVPSRDSLVAAPTVDEECDDDLTIGDDPEGVGSFICQAGPVGVPGTDEDQGPEARMTGAPGGFFYIGMDACGDGNPGGYEALVAQLAGLDGVLIEPIDAADPFGPQVLVADIERLPFLEEQFEAAGVVVHATEALPEAEWAFPVVRLIQEMPERYVPRLDRAQVQDPAVNQALLEVELGLKLQMAPDAIEALGGGHFVGHGADPLLDAALGAVHAINEDAIGQMGIPEDSALAGRLSDGQRRVSGIGGNTSATTTVSTDQDTTTSTDDVTTESTTTTDPTGGSTTTDPTTSESTSSTDTGSTTTTSSPTTSSPTTSTPTTVDPTSTSTSRFSLPPLLTRPTRPGPTSTQRQVPTITSRRFPWP